MKICVVTATRAEYGLLRPLLRAIQDDESELQLVVTGAHLSKYHGYTVQEIHDEFPILKKIPILLEGSASAHSSSAHSVSTSIVTGSTLHNTCLKSSEEIKDTPLDIAKILGRATGAFAECLAEIQPDVIVILGDRYEMLAMASAALILKIPVAHLYGGESTFGAIDESIRHTITKMAHLHFTSTSDYRRRVIQLGENPNRVYHVGSLGIENRYALKLLDQQALEKSLGLSLQADLVPGTKLKAPIFLVTFHPQTLTNNTLAQMQCLIEALEKFPTALIIFTMPNADADSSSIMGLIQNFVQSHNQAYAFHSLGQQRYFSLLQYVDVVIGNSSSGIIEVPSFKIPTVNIGQRQAGRIAAKSVLNCECESKAIEQSITNAISPKMQEFCKQVQNPYENFTVDFEKNLPSQAILKYIKQHHPLVVQKKFYDLNCPPKLYSM